MGKHRSTLGGLVAAVLLLAAPASADAFQTVTVVNQAHVPPKVLRRVEHAIARQSWQLAFWWHTQPVHFGPGGWKVYLVHRFTIDPVYGAANLPDALFGGVRVFGWHGIDLRVAVPRPYAVVGVRRHPGYRAWSVIFSHELLEMLVNPSGTRQQHGDLLEVCDPVAASNYLIDGARVSDFSLPAFWRQDWAPGARWDLMGRM